MRNCLEDLPFAPGKLFIVQNYLEAVGVMTALKAGVALDTVRRPLADTVVVSKCGRADSSGIGPQPENSDTPVLSREI